MADFSPQSSYFELNYRGPDIPWTNVYSTSFDFKSRQALIDHDVSQYSYPKHWYTTIPNDNGDAMNAHIIFPGDYDDSGATKYPVLMEVYGGPGSQKASMVFDIGMGIKMANQGFIYVLVDGRGTGYKGRKFRTAVSQHLGGHEVDDQTSAAKWLGRLKVVDPKRIGIWGWSYGGYMTAKVLEKNSDVFALGMAVAPVTDWLFYDSMYTERYMKTPAMNRDGYKESAVNRMEGFRKSKFLLLHGTGDDNVHFQNTANLVWDLTGGGITDYKVQFFTDSNHSMDANGALEQVFKLLEKFICTNFHVDSCMG